MNSISHNQTFLKLLQNYNYNMGSSNSKVEYIMLPGQSGKTRKVEELISIYSALSRTTNECEENDINIIFCSNNRALVKQTEARMKKNKHLFIGDEDSGGSDASSTSDEDASDAKIDGRVFSWFSGSGVKKIPKEKITLDILDDKISMVICCANKIRMKYVYDIIKSLQESRHFTRKIYIWLDEGDAYVKLWNNTSIDVTRFSKVAKVTPVSATFDSCIKLFDRIKVIPFEITSNQETYHAFQDCVTLTDDTAGQAPEYFNAILQKYGDIICQPGNRLFCPGDNRTETHDAIAEEALEKGFIVAIINGKQKALLFPKAFNRVPIPLFDDNEDPKDPKEIGIIIGELYRDLNLARYPFAITGHTCLSRGITFQNDLFMFDYGIIPNISNSATAYQTACRMNGNIRQLPGYKAPTVFLCSRMKEKIIQNEQIAINMARICFEKNLEDVGKEEFKKAAGIVDEQPDPKKNVPIVLPMSLAAIELIHGYKSAKKRIALRKILKEYLITIDKQALAERIDGFEVGQITRPLTDGARKRNIDDLVNAALNGKPYIVNVKEDQKDKDSWQAVFDDVGMRIIFMLYCEP
jgi:hypothetical protein